MKFNLIFSIALFAIGSSAIPTNVLNVDANLHLKAYTNEIQKYDEPYESIRTDYFEPFVHLPFTDKPVTRYFQFTLKKVNLSPDGFERSVSSINDQLPGPIIHANKGDRIVVNVTNKLGVSTSIHWHGVLQRGTNWYDGVPGQTQCPIPNDVSLVYNFTTDKQHGTYWYHSHFLGQYMDGLRGALIIHDSDDPHLNEYDFEYVVTLSDWYHRTVDVLLSLFEAPGYSGLRPIPDSPLVSGRGRYNCTAAPAGSKCKSNSPLAKYNVKKNKKYRFRIINSAGDAFFVFSIDGHKLKVIESEGEYAKPTIIEKLPINIGQRYSVIVEADQPVGNYWIRATFDKRCNRINNSTINFDSAIDRNGLGILHYEGTNNLYPTSNESTEKFVACRDLDPKHLEPLHPVINYDGPVTDFFNLTVNFQNKRASINNSSYLPQFNDPTISKITRQVSPKDLPIESNSLVFDNVNGIVEIYLWNNNLDEHPFHMHGHSFAVMFVGEQDQIPDEKKYSKRNPIIRDTVTVPENGYLVIRFISNNPGIWAFHCHIEWHVEIGMVAQLVGLPSILSHTTVPEDVASLCK